jgi:hypothetical protein
LALTTQWSYKSKQAEQIALKPLPWNNLPVDQELDG